MTTIAKTGVTSTIVTKAKTVRIRPKSGRSLAARSTRSPPSMNVTPPPGPVDHRADARQRNSKTARRTRPRRTRQARRPAVRTPRRCVPRLARVTRRARTESHAHVNLERDAAGRRDVAGIRRQSVGHVDHRRRTALGQPARFGQARDRVRKAGQMFRRRQLARRAAREPRTRTAQAGR